ncbi:aldehyde dehydrogenase family protein [Haladaptatus pallidirubidus]|uniref:Aldehyde dehydrogenase family protein n=1 Tax=Haladaptatus pallidirubidus TaxID=1008152 RepID=A0AAV3UIW9_9EURY|nr:aldehyde dehydrogenase family protein [Haladaptatus pallidirubidus]
MPAFDNYCNGQWTDSETGERFDVHNPADPTDVIGTLPQSTAADTKRAIDAAAKAQPGWEKTPAPERGSILRRAASLLDEQADELAEILSREEGKALPEASGEVARAIDILYYYGEKANDLGGEIKSSSSQDTRLETKTEPLGTVGLITPWNYPIAIPTWKLAPALATGNTVVLKPASQAPIVAIKVAKCLDEAGLPGGVLNVITGPGSEVGQTLSTSEDIDAISFTGSTSVGQMVGETAATDGKRVQLEMGGKNPTVVMPSMDVDTAAKIVSEGAFGVTGQACTATSRAIVHEDVYEEFVDELVAHADNIGIGPALDGYDMGPHVSQDELDGTLEYIDVGQSEGATLETGGSVPQEDRHESGYYIEPTVFSNVSSGMRIAQEEIFGPVVAVLPVSSYDEAVTVANDTEFGLSASIVTEDLREAHQFVDDIEAGVVKVNEKTTGLELHVPFGGMKASSSETYREQGDAGLDFFTTSKTVYLNY